MNNEDLSVPGDFSEVDTDDKFFHDKFQTKEQSRRDVAITKLLQQYVIAYVSKTKNRENYREKLFEMCQEVIFSFFIIVTILILALTASGNINSITGTISVISAFASITLSIIGLIKIITKYYFPEKDEEYITKIVEVIQQNDLLNKEANIRSFHENNTKKTQKID